MGSEQNGEHEQHKIQVLLTYYKYGHRNVYLLRKVTGTMCPEYCLMVKFYR
jgi:hypothetical protein